jgi:phage terminase large subunit-like protein
VTGEPFTVTHFATACRELTLDTGDPFVLEDFQLAFVEDLFTGRLENWLVLPEGNGKTTLLAALVLYHCAFRPYAYVPVAASSRDQAEILYRQAEGLVQRYPRLDYEQGGIFRCYSGYRRIKNMTNRSRIQISAADAKTADGVIPTMAVIEELHRHKDLSLYRTWMGKIRKRKGAQIVAISTAGEPYSDFEETRERIRQLPDAMHKGSFVRSANAQIVMHDWAVPPKADITDMRVVKAANPFSGVTPETLQSDFNSPTMTIPHWSRFKCNIPTRAVRSAITTIEWERRASKKRIPAGVPIAVGLDAGWKWDTFAFVPYWERDPDFRLLGPATILVPPRDGSTLEPDDAKRALLELHERHPIHTVVMDVTRAEDIASWIRSELGAEVVEWTQGNENEVLEYERFMTGLRVGWLFHSGDRGLTRHVMNAVGRMLPNGKTKFERPSTTRQGGDQESRVIDALKAAAMVNAHVVGPVEKKMIELAAS